MTALKKHNLRLLAGMRHYSAPADGSIPAAKQRFIPETIHCPKGFLLGSGHAGVKASNKTKDDVAIIASKTGCEAFGVFTKNKFKAAPVALSQLILAGEGPFRGVVVNSGCANAVTGSGGADDARSMATATDDLFGGSLKKQRDLPSTLVMSTGVIGQRLPVQKILDVLPPIKEQLGNDQDKWMSVAKAIMTTDTFPKIVSRQFELQEYPGVKFTMTGMSKGAGMIMPNLGTLLSIICTDAPLRPPALQQMVRVTVRESFNAISIDGDTSTNDSVVVLANGMAVPNSPQKSLSKTDAATAEAVLRDVMIDLAKLVVRDGEGATKFITIRVKNALPIDCYRVARTIANSPLVKTAMYGKDANWGRILCAIGYARDLNDNFIPANVSVGFHDPDLKQLMPLVVKGRPVEVVDEERASRILQHEDIVIEVDLGGVKSGQAGITKDFWTCDFSHEYVTINGDYRT